MRTRFAIGLIVTALALGATVYTSDTQAQVSLMVDKSGDNQDVILSWTGGSGLYDVVRSTSPKMGANTTFRALSILGSEFTDSGAAGDGTALYCYLVSDAADQPILSISMPCGTPFCTTTTTQNKIEVSGLTTAGI